MWRLTPEKGMLLVIVGCLALSAGALALLGPDSWAAPLQKVVPTPWLPEGPGPTPLPDESQEEEGGAAATSDPAPPEDPLLDPALRPASTPRPPATTPRPPTAPPTRPPITATPSGTAPGSAPGPDLPSIVPPPPSPLPLPGLPEEGELPDTGGLPDPTPELPDDLPGDDPPPTPLPPLPVAPPASNGTSVAAPEPKVSVAETEQEVASEVGGSTAPLVGAAANATVPLATTGVSLAAPALDTPTNAITSTALQLT